MREFKLLKLPGARIESDPATMTLVHWPTTFSVVRGWSERGLGRILGHRVRVEIEPTGYEWQFGDGEKDSTGRGWVRHEYEGSGRMRAAVATTYRARYRVDGGRARRIPGTVTVAGPVTVLDVRSARAQLIAGED